MRRVIRPTYKADEVERGEHELVRACWALLDRVTFDATALPICELHFEARLDGMLLVVDIRVPDRDKPEEVEWIHVWRSLLCPWYVLKNNGPEYLIRWMRETIANTIAHEIDESITVEGVRVFDPHRPLLPTLPA